jgi:hypothetical protein
LLGFCHLVDGREHIGSCGRFGNLTIAILPAKENYKLGYRREWLKCSLVFLIVTLDNLKIW